MTSLPAPLRDLILGAVMVSLVLLVLDAVGSSDLGPDTWLLVPVGAVLFAVRQGVRRAVLARAGVGPAASSPPSAAAPPAAPRNWQEDPVRVLVLASLGLFALVALAWWW